MNIIMVDARYDIRILLNYVRNYNKKVTKSSIPLQNIRSKEMHEKSKRWEEKYDDNDFIRYNKQFSILELK